MRCDRTRINPLSAKRKLRPRSDFGSQLPRSNSAAKCICLGLLFVHLQTYMSVSAFVYVAVSYVSYISP